jgi:hypothetical protein
MRIRPCVLTLTALLAAGAAGAQPLPRPAAIAPAERLTRPARDFRLDGPHLLKADWRGRDLLADDFNGDGRVDLAYIANERSALVLYIQSAESAPGAWRFERQNVTLDRALRAAVAVDADGDGRTDIVGAAAPGRLVVYIQDDKGRLSPPREHDFVASRLALGDLNADGRPELVLFHAGRFDILPGARRGITFESSARFFTAGDPAGEIMLIDFDGDGRTDIVYHDARRASDLVVRLQSAEGTFPSEIRMPGNVMRQATALPLRGEPSAVLGLVNQNRQGSRLGLGPVPAESDFAARLAKATTEVIPFDPERIARRPFTTVADVDGDGRPDLVIASPDSAELRILRQSRSAALSALAVPSLQGIESVSAAAGGLLVFSREERAMGLAAWDRKSSTLGFPRLLPLEGAPLGVVLARGGNAPSLVAAMPSGGGSNRDRWTLATWTLDAEGRPTNRQVRGGESPEEFTGRVTGMAALDLNRDGIEDLVVYTDFAPSSIFLRAADGSLSRFTPRDGMLSGLLADAKPGLLRAARLADGAAAEVLVVRERFARVLHLDAEGNVVVTAQLQGRNSAARIALAATGLLERDQPPCAVLLDRGNKELTVYTIPAAGAPSLVASIPVEDIAYTALDLADLNGDRRAEIILTAEDRLSIVHPRPLVGPLVPGAELATAVTDGGYGRLYTLDVLAGGAPEVAAIEMRENLLEFFEIGRGAAGAPAFHRFHQFRVFDSEQSIARRPDLNAAPEPRELLAADLNDDGTPEVIGLIHDNIIIYHQVPPTR